MAGSATVGAVGRTSTSCVRGPTTSSSRPPRAKRNDHHTDRTAAAQPTSRRPLTRTGRWTTSVGLLRVDIGSGAMMSLHGVTRERKPVPLLTSGLRDAPWRASLQAESSAGALSIGLRVVGSLARLRAVERRVCRPIVTTNPTRRSSSELQVVGLSGRSGTGKTSAASVLEVAGYRILSSRAVLARILETRGEQVTRQALQRLGGEVHRTVGQRWLFDQITGSLGQHGRHVIDGLRFSEDHAYLAEKYRDSFLHLHLEAPQTLRRSRFISRGGTHSEFDAAESHVTESEAPVMRGLAHRVVVNAGSSEQLGTAVLQAVREDNGGDSVCQ